MSDVKRRKAAAQFAEEWVGKGYEKGESQPFWLALLRDVFGVEKPESYIKFEGKVIIDNTSFIDGFISETNVLIEQKSIDKDLLAPIKQSKGGSLTPFQQAKRYSAELPYSERPRWIITCNFKEFHIYDMENPQGKPESILLTDLPSEYHRLNFLVDTASANIAKEEQISLEAGTLVGKLYDAILKQYRNPDSPETLRSLNMLCVRLVFCLYAEDSGLLGSRTQFRDYIRNVANTSIDDVHIALGELFSVLNIEEKDRNPYMKKSLLVFPYVNGGLFDGESIVIPYFTKEIVNILVCDAAGGFNWSDISPTIFGAVFESTLNPATRRSGGMHYTSILNIHKVIDPLFLDSLNAEFEEIKAKKQTNIRQNALKAFQEKLSGLIFLDPAAGSGNFLTETYISLRRLENQVLKLLFDDGQIRIDTMSIIKVSIGQFYGFEINYFAVTVAKTALWIAESQMMKETASIIIDYDFDFLPLKTSAHITECNALRVDWEELVPKDELDYIMGNPPFVGYKYQNEEQKKDIAIITKIKNLDYVAMWYIKAAEYIQHTKIRCAFVSTNSITQGEQVAALWKPLFEQGIYINFGVSTFKWNNETKGFAAVHCVIIGFSVQKTDNDLNPYLINAPTVFIEKRSKPICNVPNMIYGSEPREGGNLIIESDDYNEFIAKEPEAKKYIKRFVGSEEYINNLTRYCLWLNKDDLSEIKKMPLVMERIEKTRQFRLSCKRKGTQEAANKPYLFESIRQPTSEYIIVPVVSSERRKYIPIGFVSPEIIVNNAVQIIPNATLYDFGILTSSVHMAWTSAVCGRLEMRYRYSSTLVYNNFVWVDVSENQRAEIQKLAKVILDVREQYMKADVDCSLAELYGDNFDLLYYDLKKAHIALDKAVMKLYGFSAGANESEIVAGLMERHRELMEGVMK